MFYDNIKKIYIHYIDKKRKITDIKRNYSMFNISFKLKNEIILNKKLNLENFIKYLNNKKTKMHTYLYKSIYHLNFVFIYYFFSFLCFIDFFIIF